MPRGRRYSRRSFRSTGQRYSSETSSVNISVTQTNQETTPISQSFVVVPSTLTYGVRKVKNPTVQLECIVKTTEGVSVPVSLLWALVFVPEGQQVGKLAASTDLTVAVSLYEPNQHVIMQGCGGYSDPIIARTRLARNLQAGDSVHFVFVTNSTWPQGSVIFVHGTINFAVTY